MRIEEARSETLISRGSGKRFDNSTTLPESGAVRRYRLSCSDIVAAQWKIWIGWLLSIDMTPYL